jgi:glycosyltransferase involved in cell wall biosynthesis
MAGVELRKRYTAADLGVFTRDEVTRFAPRGDGDPRNDVDLAWELLYRLEPELYDRLASAERLHPGILGWLTRAVDRIAEVGAGTGRLTIEVYGDVYDAAYNREQIDPRRGWPGVTIRCGVQRTSLWEAMARVAVVLYPSRWDEPFGLAAAEAQACGTPVVAFDRGGLAEVIAEGVTGFLVPPDDVRGAADAVSKTAGISRSACREHAEGQLDLEVSLDAHERLYRRAAGG